MAATLLTSSWAWPADAGVPISRCELEIKTGAQPPLSYQRISAVEDLARHEITIEYEYGTEDAAGIKARAHAVCRFDKEGHLISGNVNGLEFQVAY